MPKIHFHNVDGGEDTVEADAGTSVMQAAMVHDVPGIVAECGGSMMCATCHVYVDPDWAERLQPCGEVEDEMLESAASPRQESSRLSCQITMTDELDGLVVHTPEAQL
ncbi:2Fe-2S iron-sulfur cluster-binding protein [Streptomyces sp. NPDC102360]|uniref:2Fe-2S iron-sulfur cluster-binding protein n=1 Tax=Streptomyces sp. NPDC102360 TaxID=3366160 RepID=UPI0037F4CD6C